MIIKKQGEKKGDK